jgi:hypothetical protein
LRQALAAQTGFNGVQYEARRENREMATSDQATRAASFLIQALELDLDSESIGQDLTVVSSEGEVTTYATELEASFGPAAFLIYVYRYVDPAFGGTGRSEYEAAIETLQTAAARNTPGPRLLANGESDTEGFLLATTPATYRQMMGSAEPELDDPLVPRSGKDATEIRRDSAQELLTHLKAADVAARQWLAAIREDGAGQSTMEADPELVEFNENETELALFLLDERSIQNVLKAVNLFITAARDAASRE